MSYCDTAGSHEGEMLRPTLSSSDLDQPRDPVQPPGCDGHCRGEAERNAMQYYADLSRQGSQCAQIAPRSTEIILGDDLDQIDPVEMRKDPGRQLGAPAEPELVAWLNCCRTRHSRLRSLLRRRIRTMTRNHLPRWPLSCRHGGSRRNRWQAVPICRTLPPIASHRWSLPPGGCLRPAGEAPGRAASDLSASCCRGECEGVARETTPPPVLWP